MRTVNFSQVLRDSADAGDPACCSRLISGSGQVPLRARDGSRVPCLGAGLIVMA